MVNSSITNALAIAPYGQKLVWGSNTTVKIGLGRCLDSNGVVDLIVDSTNSTGGYITINTAGVGANGMDTGVLAQGLLYIYLIGDSMHNNATKAIASIAAPSVGPKLPTGYDCFKDLGCVGVDASPYILNFTESGKGASRTITLDTALSVLSGGTSATYADVSLAAAVPPVTDELVTFIADFTPNASNDLASLKQAGSAATVVTNIYGPVAAKKSSAQLTVPVGIASSAAKVSYLVTASGALTLFLNSYTYSR